MLKCKLVSVHLDIVPILRQDRCIVCAERTIGSEIILATPDDTPRDEGQVKAHFSLFRDSGNIAARWIHGLRRTYHRLGNHFGRTRWNS